MFWGVQSSSCPTCASRDQGGLWHPHRGWSRHGDIPEDIPAWGKQESPWSQPCPQPWVFMGCPQGLQQEQGFVSCRIQALPLLWGLHTCWTWNEQPLKEARSLFRTSSLAVWLLSSPLELGISQEPSAPAVLTPSSIYVLSSTTTTPNLPAYPTCPLQECLRLFCSKFFIMAALFIHSHLLSMAGGLCLLPVSIFQWLEHLAPWMSVRKGLGFPLGGPSE